MSSDEKVWVVFSLDPKEASVATKYGFLDGNPTEATALAAIRAALARKEQPWVGTWMHTNHGDYVLGELTKDADLAEASSVPQGRVLVIPLPEEDAK